MAQGNYLLPGIYYLNYAKPGEEINKHIVIYKGADNVTESHKIYRNSVGKFEEPIDIKPIVLKIFKWRFMVTRYQIYDLLNTFL